MTIHDSVAKRKEHTCDVDQHYIMIACLAKQRMACHKLCGVSRDRLSNVYCPYVYIVQVAAGPSGCEPLISLEACMQGPGVTHVGQLDSRDV